MVNVKMPRSNTDNGDGHCLLPRGLRTAFGDALYVSLYFVIINLMAFHECLTEVLGFKICRLFSGLVCAGDRLWLHVYELLPP